MAAEKRNGAGSRLAGLLERSTPPEPPAGEPEEPETPTAAEPVEAEPSSASKGRGAAPRRNRSAEARAAKRIKGRTIYIPDDLFERIIVQAHRRDRTISEYVVAILDRQVPDHRVVRVDQTDAA
jgi:hypothetical protein